jgi:hypothetical protein
MRPTRRRRSAPASAPCQPCLEFALGERRECFPPARLSRRDPGAGENFSNLLFGECAVGINCLTSSGAGKPRLGLARPLLVGRDRRPVLFKLPLRCADQAFPSGDDPAAPLCLPPTERRIAFGIGERQPGRHLPLIDGKCGSLRAGEPAGGGWRARPGHRAPRDRGFSRRAGSPGQPRLGAFADYFRPLDFAEKSNVGVVFRCREAATGQAPGGLEAFRRRPRRPRKIKRKIKAGPEIKDPARSHARRDERSLGRRRAPRGELKSAGAPPRLMANAGGASAAYLK